MNQNPAPLPLRTGPDGQLQAMGADGRWVPVSVFRCFPWTAPEGHLSLRDVQGEEVAYVVDAALLDAESRKALEAALSLAGFTFAITGIDSIQEDFELRVWKVRTAQGKRTFQTELDAWPEALPGGGWLLRDVTGDLYRFPPVDKLDPASRLKFWAFMD